MTTESTGKTLALQYTSLCGAIPGKGDTAAEPPNKYE